MKDIRIAAVSCCSSAGNIRQNLDAMTKFVRLAKDASAKIICFPEMNITGYSILCEDIENTAEPISGSVVSEVIRLAASENIVILSGMAEKDKTGKIFASHIVVKPDGDIGIYRKIHIAPPERNVFSAGNDIPVFEAYGMRFGIQLCYDAHFPELCSCMAVKGAETIFIPHASPRGNSQEKITSWMRHLPARAYDNSIFIIACNAAGDNGKGLYFPGLAIAIAPDGNVIAKNLTGGTILYADLKAETLENLRKHPMRFFLPNRRPEIYKMNDEKNDE